MEKEIGKFQQWGVGGRRKRVQEQGKEERKKKINLGRKEYKNKN